MKFTINRSKWRCGGLCDNQRGKGTYVELLNDNGYFCILGDVVRQCGIPIEEIKNRGEPSEIYLESDEPDKRLVDIGLLTLNGGNTSFAYEAMNINDNPHYNDEEREVRLINLFKEHGHELVFEGDYNVLN